MHSRLLLLTLMTASCSANTFSPDETKASECFAMSIVYKNIAERTGAPTQQVTALRAINTNYTRIFQNTVAQMSEKDGDVNGYSRLTKAVMSEVARDPFAWETRFKECVR